MCGRPGDNNDVVSILWLPLNAVITDVSMVKKTTDGVAASNVTSAKKTECTKCDDVFRNIASNGIVVTRLDKEGVQEDKFRTVRLMTALCGMHNIALRVRYEYPLENGRIEHYLRPGYRAGNLNFELTTPNAKVTTNFESALDPSCNRFNKYKTMRAEMREQTCEKSSIWSGKNLVSRKKNSFLKTKTHKFYLSLGQQESFGGRFGGVSRWLSMSIRIPRKQRLPADPNRPRGLNFRMTDENDTSAKTCESLVIADPSRTNSEF